MTNIFKGSGVALVTPFNDDFSIDFHGLKKLVRYQIDNGTDFLVVQGTTGESPTLSMKEKLEVLKVVQEENDGRLPIVFGVGGNDTVGVCETLRSLPAGIDGILSVSPYYNKPTQKGIIDHYVDLAEATTLPIILYNVPGRTGSNMMASTTLELAKIENIVAVKEASGDLIQIMDIIQDKPEGFDVISGDDAITMPMINLGAAGVISVVANAFPKRFSEMVHESIANNVTLARDAHYDLLHVTNLFFTEGNPGGVKVSLAKQGMMKETMRKPLYPVSEGLKLEIEKETERIL
jgi:4-hydroxy-tetrahydrodipicolinate synthase